MRVEDLIKILEELNPEATLTVHTGGYVTHNWEVNYGGSEGVTKQNCESVSIHVEPEPEK